MNNPKTPDPKTTPDPEATGQASTIPGYEQPPAGGSVGPPPSQSPFEPAPEPKDEKAHKNEKAHKDDDEKAPHKENDRDKSHHR
jgi:hypothetical protein